MAKQGMASKSCTQTEFAIRVRLLFWCHLAWHSGLYTQHKLCEVGGTTLTHTHMQAFHAERIWWTLRQTSSVEAMTLRAHTYLWHLAEVCKSTAAAKWATSKGVKCSKEIWKDPNKTDRFSLQGDYLQEFSLSKLFGETVPLSKFR